MTTILGRKKKTAEKKTGQYSLWDFLTYRDVWLCISPSTNFRRSHAIILIPFIPPHPHPQSETETECIELSRYLSSCFLSLNLLVAEVATNEVASPSRNSAAAPNPLELAVTACGALCNR